MWNRGSRKGWEFGWNGQSSWKFKGVWGRQQGDTLSYIEGAENVWDGFNTQKGV